tara:strand:- start:29 stop:439 length:411 start_codon:yes stop_codon:yes gene_type:complete
VIHFKEEIAFLINFDCNQKFLLLNYHLKKMNNNSQELDSQGYTILKNAAPMELISSIQSYAQEFLKCEKNSTIIEAMSQLEILDKKKFYSFCSEMGKILPITQIASISSILSLVKGVLKTENIYLTDEAIYLTKLM